MRRAHHVLAAAMTLLVGAAACSRDGRPLWPSASSTRTGPLIAARTTMVTAWEFPRNPLTDATLDDSKLANEIRLGFRIFTNTPGEASRFTPSKVSCNNCHLNGGQRERSLPLVDVAAMFPEYNRRSGRLYTLGDRIVDCFLRSENATGRLEAGAGEQAGEEDGDLVPAPTSKEVLAVAAYITWLARGAEVGKNPAWRGQNVIAASNVVPIEKLDSQKGKAIFLESCSSCHGVDGQGVAVGDKKPGPLWGPDSWNDGAGAARVYTLAGIIRYSMPYLSPGSLTDEEAQQVARYITSKPRPRYPFKSRDYVGSKVPPDAVYYGQE